MCQTALHMCRNYVCIANENLSVAIQAALFKTVIQSDHCSAASTDVHLQN
jgi:hypothetical protein